MASSAYETHSFLPAVSDQFHSLKYIRSKFRYLLLSTETAVHLSSRILNSGDPSIIIGSVIGGEKTFAKLATAHRCPVSEKKGSPKVEF